MHRRKSRVSAAPEFIRTDERVYFFPWLKTFAEKKSFHKQRFFGVMEFCLFFVDSTKKTFKCKVSSGLFNDEKKRTFTADKSIIIIPYVNGQQMYM